jgi:hypothetical protein
MNNDSLNEALGGSIVATWNPWGFHKTASILLLDATVLFSTSEVFESRTKARDGNALLDNARQNSTDIQKSPITF